MGQDGPNFSSPFFLAVLGVMSAAIGLSVYHCLRVTWCNRRTTNRAEGLHAEEGNVSSVQISTAQLMPPAYTYREGKGTVGGGEGESMCAVCLCEFKDGEVVRLMPECKHYFHVPCIDKWLSSHSNCPMCRTETTPPHYQQHPGAPLPLDFGSLPEFGG